MTGRELFKMLRVALGLFLCAFARVVLAENEKGSTTVTVTIATHDIAAGTKVTLDDIGKRDIPQSLVTKSFIKPDSAMYIADQVTSVPILKGDVLRWSFFETTAGPIAECRAALGPEPSAMDGVARARAAVVATH
jgi:Flp pilus assembly protein CpaB